MIHEKCMFDYKLLNQEFNNLTTTGNYYRNKTSHRFYEVICKCGNKLFKRYSHLKSGNTGSCGRQCLYYRNIKHGCKRRNDTKRVYHSWSSAWARCTNINSNRYHLYGARGITVCERWEDFNCFLEDMGDRPEGKSLDRINNDLGYFKENCKWSTPKEQANNRRKRKSYN